LLLVRGLTILHQIQESIKFVLGGFWLIINLRRIIKLELILISLYNPTKFGGLMPRNLLLQFEFLSLPSNCFGATLPDFKECFAKAVKAAGQECSRVKCWVSQYRIGILVEGLPECSLDCLKEIRGPKASTAYDYNNQPTPAAKGFAAAQGVELKDLITKEVDGEKYLFAVRSVAGQQLEKGLVRLKDELVAAIPFNAPKWKAESSFPQPLLGFTAMLDDKVLEMKLEGISSSGHLLIRKNSGFERVRINSVYHYSDIMNELGILSDLTERRKNIEAQVQLVLPEGYRIRAEQVDLNQSFLFSESLTPFLLKYDLESLDIPNFAVEYFISNYTDYYSCENAVGELLPAVVGFSSYETPLDQELECRDSYLQERFGRMSKLWALDRKAMKLWVAALFDSQKKPLELLKARVTELEGSKHEPMLQAALWFEKNYNASFDMNLLGLLVYLSEGMREAKVWSYSPEMSLTLIWELLEDADIMQSLSGLVSIKAFSEVVCELQGYFSGKLPSPKSVESSIFAFCFLSELYFYGINKKESYMDKIWWLLISSKIKLDLFEFFSRYGDFNKALHKAWLKFAYDVMLKETRLELSNDYYYGLSALDPSSLYESLGDLKALDGTKIDFFVSLFNRIYGKIERINDFLWEAPIGELEKELDSGLKSIEIHMGINYNSILNFFVKEKINIEASLLNLPSVLNEDDKEYYSRISILQRLHRQLSRLPFLKKESV
jgi:hypothetical protein